MPREAAKVSRTATLAFAALLTSCSNSAERAIVRGQGVFSGISAEILTTRSGASSTNSSKVSLISEGDRQRFEVFKGSGGEDPTVSFLKDNLIIITYCGAIKTDSKNYIYSVGSKGPQDIRIVVVTYYSKIDNIEFCSKI